MWILFLKESEFLFPFCLFLPAPFSSGSVSLICSFAGKEKDNLWSTAAAASMTGSQASLTRSFNGLNCLSFSACCSSFCPQLCGLCVSAPSNTSPLFTCQHCTDSRNKWPGRFFFHLRGKVEAPGSKLCWHEGNSFVVMNPIEGFRSLNSHIL